MFRRIKWKTPWRGRVPAAAAGGVVYIGIGTNIGTPCDRLRRLNQCLLIINRFPGTKVIVVSSLYETPPWGNLNQDSFYNGVLAIRTHMNPHDLLSLLKNTELRLGRQHRERWGPRELDLDILLTDGLRLKTHRLEIPHPQIAHRNFVLVPLREIMPGKLKRSDYL